MNGTPSVDPGSPRGTFGIPSSAAASTCFARHIRRVIVCKTGTEYETYGDLGKRRDLIGR
jgi:hypothetical protein